jgi:tetratricopeptide (TPR) repeat protein
MQRAHRAPTASIHRTDSSRSNTSPYDGSSVPRSQPSSRPTTATSGTHGTERSAKRRGTEQAATQDARIRRASTARAARPAPGPTPPPPMQAPRRTTRFPGPGASRPTGMHHNAGDAKVWIRQAQSQAKRGDYREAIASYEEAFYLHPTDPWIMAGLAKCYAADGAARTARAYYRRALTFRNEPVWHAALMKLEKDKQQADAAERQAGRGRRLLDDRRYTEAAGCFERALRATPGCGELRFQHGQALYLAGKHKAATSVLEQATEALPEDARVYTTLGKTYLARIKPLTELTHQIVNTPRPRGFFGKLRAFFAAPKPKVSPCDADMRQFEAGRERNRRLARSALAAFDVAVACDVSHDRAWAGKAQALETLGRGAEAADAWRSAALSAPWEPRHWARLGAILRQRRAYDEAIAAYQTAVRLDPRPAWEQALEETAITQGEATRF